MKLEVSDGTGRLEIEITGIAGKRTVRVDGRDVSPDLLRLPDGQYSLIVDGRVFDVSVSTDMDSWVVIGRLGFHRFRISDPRRSSPSDSAETGQTGVQRICAEMPGRVVRLLVKEGEKVAYDQGLLILEAMKMQNEIRSPKSGMVGEIGVQDGRTVGTGDFLISIE